MDLTTLLLILLTFLPGTAAPSGTTATGTVTDITDGDTITVQRAPGDTTTVRLLGVDTPEKYGEVHPEEFNATNASCLKQYSHAASDYAADTLQGEQVTLRYDPLAGRRGDYGRTLAYVQHNGTVFNEALLRNGLARTYRRSTYQEKAAYLQLERDTQAAADGLWQC